MVSDRWKLAARINTEFPWWVKFFLRKGVLRISREEKGGTEWRLVESNDRPKLTLKPALCSCIFRENHSGF